MKMIRKTCYAVIATLLTIGATGCSGKQAAAEAADSDSATTDTMVQDSNVVEEVEEVAEETTPTEFILTEKGFGELKIGGKAKAVKENPVAGLYDKATYFKQMNEMEGEEEISGELTLNGKSVGYFTADTDGTIYFIQFDSPAVKIKVNGNVYAIGDSFKSLRKEKGVSIDDYGSAVVNGITIYDENDKIVTFNIGSRW